MHDLAFDSDRIYRTAAALHHPIRLAMLEVLRSSGSAYPGELAEQTGVSAQSMTKHIASLQEGGLVRAQVEGRRVRLELATSDVLVLLNGLSCTEATVRCDRHASSSLGVAS